MHVNTGNIDEAARLLSISKHTARDYVKRGLIPHIRLGRRILVPIARLRQLADTVA